MSRVGMPIFDHSVMVANSWVHEVSDELGPGRQRAYQALRAVLQAMRDRLSAEEAADLGARLPLLLRGVYFEGWRPRGAASRSPRGALVDDVELRLSDGPPMNSEEAVRAVLRVLKRRGVARDLAPSPEDEFGHPLTESTPSVFSAAGATARP